MVTMKEIIDSGFDIGDGCRVCIECYGYNNCLEDTEDECSQFGEIRSAYLDSDIAIIQFFRSYWPENPSRLIRSGKRVPVTYLGNWYCTYGCNNWRKAHGLPMWRKKLQFKGGR